MNDARDSVVDLTIAHPWLKWYEADFRNYISPAYYERLLPPYQFDGRSDLQLLQEFVSQSPSAGEMDILELGCGSGRATRVLAAVESITSLTLVDISRRMLDRACATLGPSDPVSPVCADALSYVDTTNATFSTVVSMWSLSHSVHQHLLTDPTRDGFVRRSLRRLIAEVLRPRGRLLVVHVDAASDEQRPLFELKREIYPLYAAHPDQSPSKRVLDEVLWQCSADGLGTFSCIRLLGDPIVYESVEQAMETYFNFHLATHWNRSAGLRSYLGRIETQLRTHLCESGEVAVRPGCFVYEFHRC